MTDDITTIAYLLGLAGYPLSTLSLTSYTEPLEVKSSKRPLRPEFEEWEEDWEELCKKLPGLMSLAEWMGIDKEELRELYGPKNALSFYIRLLPISIPIAVPTVRISERAPVFPPPWDEKGKPIEPLKLIWNGIDELAASTTVVALLLGRRGCIACPIGHTLIKLPLPPRYFLAHLARVNVPVGCSPYSFWASIVSYPLKMALIHIVFNLPVPIDMIRRAAVQVALIIAGVAVGAYKLLYKLCKAFSATYLRKIVGPCLASAYLDIFFQAELIRGCLDRAAEQLKIGIEIAENLGDHANSTATECVPL